MNLSKNSLFILAILTMALLAESFDFDKRPVSRRKEKKYPKPKFQLPNGPTNLLDQSPGHSKQILDKVNKANRMSPNRLSKVSDDTYENGFSRQNSNSNTLGLHSMKKNSALSGHMTIDVQDTNHWKSDPGKKVKL